MIEKIVQIQLAIVKMAKMYQTTAFIVFCFTFII